MREINNMNHVMIDIETLSHKPDACIIQIGAVSFDRNGIKEQRQWDIEPPVNSNSGSITLQSVLWWAKEDPKLLATIANSPNKVPLHQALDELSSMFPVGDKGTNRTRVWANAPSFDCVILRSAYNNMGMDTPWMFFNELCFRTIGHLYTAVHGEKFKNVRERNKTGNSHDALSDAVSQANAIIEINSTLNIL